MQQIFMQIPALVFCVVVCVMFFRTRKQLNSVKSDLEKAKQNGIMQDLEFATTDQLMEELTSRKDMYVLLTPHENKGDRIGMEITVQGMQPHILIQTLQAATMLMCTQMEKKGFSAPRHMPPISDWSKNNFPFGDQTDSDSDSFPDQSEPWQD